MRRIVSFASLQSLTYNDVCHGNFVTCMKFSVTYLPPPSFFSPSLRFYGITLNSALTSTNIISLRFHMEQT